MAKKVKNPKETNFAERLSKVAQEAFDFLKNTPKEGQRIDLFTKQEAEENDNIVYDMPNVSHVDKYQNYTEYGVIAISKKNKKTTIHLEGKGEEGGTKKDILLSEMGTWFQLSDNDLCNLADEISKLLK